MQYVHASDKIKPNFWPAKLYLTRYILHSASIDLLDFSRTKEASIKFAYFAVHSILPVSRS